MERPRSFHLPVVIALLFSLLGSAITTTPVAAASFSVSNATELINAINTANSNGTADTITLTDDITLTSINNGDNGLPVISADGGNALTIEGGGFTISRSSAFGTPRFRFFEVPAGATLNVQNVTLLNGSPLSAGGAIFSLGALNIINSVFDGNSGECDPSCGAGGGAVFSNGILTISNGVFSNNVVDGLGGAINNSGTATITDSTFFQNSAGDYGGGISNFGALTIINSTIMNNTAVVGGGIINYDTLIIANSTIANNSATSYGGGICNMDGAITSINNTFSNNASANGGNFYHANGTIQLYNTILSTTIFLQGNCAGIGTITAGTDNLATDVTCGSATPVSSLVLKLNPTLADNGGPTQTLALLSGSAAIDAGNAVTCAAAPVNNMDQRGHSRLQGASCDVGAYETTPLPTITSAVYDASAGTLTVTGTDFQAYAGANNDISARHQRQRRGRSLCSLENAEVWRPDHHPHGRREVRL